MRGDDPAHAAALGALLCELGGLLGILQDDPSTCAVVNQVPRVSSDAGSNPWLSAAVTRTGTGLGPMRSATS